MALEGLPLLDIFDEEAVIPTPAELTETYSSFNDWSLSFISWGCPAQGYQLQQYPLPMGANQPVPWPLHELARRLSCRWGSCN